MDAATCPYCAWTMPATDEDDQLDMVLLHYMVSATCPPDTRRN